LCLVVVANMRHRAVVDRSAAAHLATADACTSSQAQLRPHLEQNGQPASGGNRRRTRKKRDSGAARAAVVTAADSTDTSTEDPAAADASRPKLRKKKKTRSKKTKKNSSECLRVEAFMAGPVEAVATMTGDGDIEDWSNEGRPNGAVTAENLSSSFLDVCITLPEIDRLSCEPDGSSSRPEAEVIDLSVCSTVDSSVNRGRSPAPQPSPLPPSTTASTSLYDQQSGFLSEVHGSLPLLSRAFDNDRRLVTASDQRSTGDVCRLPKSVSLQGYRHLLSVDGPASARHHRHRRHLTAAIYRPLAGQHGRHALSRLDVEYINRSQIFQMISGQSHHTNQCWD